MKRTSTLICIQALMLCWIGCGPAAETATKTTESAPAAEKPPSNVVEITIEGLTFKAPDEIPSGWVTFRMTNYSAMTHFGILERMPEGFGIEEHQSVVAPIFQQGMDLINKGDPEGAKAKFGEIPDWFGKVVLTGGPGLTGPATSSQATVYLTPGVYVLECYIKTGGLFHSYNPAPDQYGMVHQFTVTDEATDTDEPTATAEIRISSEKGIEAPETLEPGEQTIAVHYVDQKLYENFVGHDVHVARLEGDTDLATLEGWMDWTSPKGFETPAPVEFIGGLNEMPAGQTGYFTISLEPGRYALVAEVPASRSKGMLKTFEVADKEQ